MSSLSTWLRLCVLTLSFCAAPSIVWAQTPVPKTDDCIVSWNPVTTDIYNLPTLIQGYHVYAAPDTVTLQWGVPVDVPPSTTPQTTCNALGLNQSGIYAIAVTVSNAAATSDFSEIVRVDLTIVPLTLTVAGAPNLPLSARSILVTVGFTNGTPTKVQFSVNGFPPFTTWPTDAFFTLSPDGKSLTGSMCPTFACTPGQYSMSAVATYATGETATASVALNVADSVPSSP